MCFGCVWSEWSGLSSRLKAAYIDMSAKARGKPKVERSSHDTSLPSHGHLDVTSV